MITTRHLKNPPRIGIASFFHVLHPCAVHTERDLVFSFARNCAGVAPNALAIVDNEAVSHSRVLSGQTTLSHEAVRCLGVKLLQVFVVELARITHQRPALQQSVMWYQGSRNQTRRCSIRVRHRPYPRVSF